MQRFFFEAIRTISKATSGKAARGEGGDEDKGTGKAFAWEKTIHALAKEFTNGNWKEVTDWNFYVFCHRANFLTNKIKEEHEQQKAAIRKAKR